MAVGALGGKPVIVSGGADGTVRVWNLADGKPLYKPLAGHEGRVHAVAVGTLEGKPAIVSGGTDRNVRLWDLASTLAVVDVDCVVYSVALAPPSGIVLGGSKSLTVIQLKI